MLKFINDNAGQGDLPFLKQWKHLCRAGDVVPEWRRFSVFRDWMADQDWENKKLSAGALVLGNTVYGPDFCIFVTAETERFLLESVDQGVWFVPAYGHYWARCFNPFTNSVEHLCSTLDESAARAEWLKRKAGLAKQLADVTFDREVKQALARFF